MFLHPAEISHSRVYSVRTSVLIALAGLQADSSTSNRSGTHFCPKPLHGHLRYAMSGNLTDKGIGMTFRIRQSHTF